MMVPRRWSAMRPRPRAGRGIAALEMALLLPVLVLLPTAVFDLGRALHHHERLCQTVRAAARHLGTGDAADPVRQAQAVSLALYGSLQGAGTPVVPGLSAANVQILEPGSSPGVQLVATAAGPVSLVTVSIGNWRYEPLLLPSWASLPMRTVSVTMPYQFF